MHYFETGMELLVSCQVRLSLSVSVGEAHGGEAMDRGLRRHIVRGLVVGDLLWVVVIAFLFVVITGVLRVTVFP